MESLTLRIIVFKQEDMYVAQCLDHDIAVQGPDMATLQERFEETVACEGSGLKDLGPAPDQFQALWDGGLGLQSKLDNTEMRLAA